MSKILIGGITGNGNKISSVPDWNQNDPEGEGYVKNRTHYSEGESTIILDCEARMDVNSHLPDSTFFFQSLLKPDRVYTVVMHNSYTRLYYERQPKPHPVYSDNVFIGNLSFEDSSFADTGEYFCIVSSEHYSSMYVRVPFERLPNMGGFATCQFTLTEIENITKLDSKYLKLSKNIGIDAEGNIFSNQATPTIEQVLRAGYTARGGALILRGDGSNNIYVASHEILISHHIWGKTGFRQDGTIMSSEKTIYTPTAGFKVHGGQAVLDADAAHAVTPLEAAIFRTKVETVLVQAGFAAIDENISIAKLNITTPSDVVLSFSGCPKPQCTVLILNKNPGDIAVYLPQTIPGASEIYHFDGMAITIPANKAAEVSLLTVDGEIFTHFKIQE